MDTLQFNTNLDMTKQEAITAMQRGEKVTHKYFSHDEWITINDYCQIEDESGYRYEQDSFWLDRGTQFDVGWELFEAPCDGENDVLHDVIVSCEHEEKLMQGDGFTYSVCSKCGEDLG